MKRFVYILLSILVLSSGMFTSKVEASTNLYWNTIQLPSSDKVNEIKFNEVVWDGSQFFAVGNQGIIATSPDGYEWDYSNSYKIMNFDFITETHSLGNVVILASREAMGRKEYYQFIFKNGTEQNAFSLGSGYTLNSVASDEKGNIVAVGGKFIDNSLKGFVLNSFNPSASLYEIDHKQNSGVLTNWLNSVVWGKDKFVAVGMNAKIIVSSDGAKWKNINRTNIFDELNNENIKLKQVIWDGSQFVAVGDRSTVLTSKDGLNWVKVHHDDQNGQKFNSIAKNRSQYVVVGDGGICYTSTDLKKWVAVNIKQASDLNLKSIIWNGERFIAVGNKSIVYTTIANINIVVNGKQLVSTPMSQTVNKNTMVHVKAIASALGVTITFDKKNMLLVCKKDNKSVEFKVGDKAVKIIDTKAKTTSYATLNVPPKLINGEIILPVRFFSETFNAKVETKNGTVVVTSNKK